MMIDIFCKHKYAIPMSSALTLTTPSTPASGIRHPASGIRHPASGKLSSRLILCQAPTGVFKLFSHPFGNKPLSAFNNVAAAFSYLNHSGARPPRSFL
jgi:hypothetical protein